jgi:predicted ribosome quality control (RQC) complex YloA/Tae2 family protein
LHNNYYFLKKLSAVLETELIGTVISECFSQNKDELIIRFETATVPFLIKATLTPKLSTLSFPREFHRARKNSVDLFETIIGRRVQGIRQFSNERSFLILLSDDIRLLFKMHGNKANILVFEGDAEPALFKNSLQADANIKLAELDRSIDWSFEGFEKNSSNRQNHYFTFGKLIWQYLDELGFSTKNDQGRWQMILTLRDELEKSKTFFVTDVHGKLALTPFEYGVIKKSFTNPIEALNDFFYTITQASGIEDQQKKLISSLTSRIQSSKNYYRKTFEKAKQVEQNNSYKVWADLIMANMHAIAPGTDKIVVENFYNENKPVEIKLRKDQSPQKNAETFYRKSKNQQIEIDKLNEILANKLREIDVMEKQLDQVRKAKSMKDLSEFIKINPTKENDPSPLPYHEFIFSGYKIWVGRNAESNDILTLKLSYKEDLWLHAKDVAGSHVLIKYQAGKNFPKDVIQRAAELAAYNSKRKNDSLCPVVVTPKKFVRKRKGDPAGAVVVEKEDVVMVVPKLS